MNVKGTPKRVTMRSSKKSVYVPVFALMTLLSPGDCGCVYKGSGKSFIECSDIFPEVSSYSSPNVHHLDINHVLALPVFRLAPSHFAGNPNLQYLQSIRIHNTTLISVDENAFSGLQYLTDLEISDNSLLKTFHRGSISEARDLKILSLSGSNRLFSKISGPILISETLEELDLSRCEIEYLHALTFHQLKKLHYINLASNKISKIPASTFFGLHHLMDLDLSENSLNNFPWFMLRNNSAIESLKLQGNPISDIPQDIFSDNDSVIKLDLSETELTSISIPPLQSLLELNLGGSRVSSLKGLSKFPELAYLNLSYTKITEVHSTSFENNTRLETIRLSGNTNLSFPRRFIGSFVFVELMDMSNCGLVYLMPTLFEEMTEIVTLNLSLNAFNDSESLGRTLSPLQRLEVLDLAHNKLRVIEEGDFSGYGGLKTLLLSGNPLISPPSLSNTPFLRHLDLSRCSLTRLHLPTLFRQAPYLHYVYLPSNNLSTPKDEAYLDPFEDENSSWNLPGQLTVLDLKGNPWSCDPPFLSLVNEAIERDVAPAKEPPQRTGPSEGGVRDVEQEWEQLVDRACKRGHYDVAVTLMPLMSPPALEGTVTAQFPIWLTVGILAALFLGSTILLYILYRRHAVQLHQSKGLIPLPKSESVKISVTLGSAAGGKKMTSRVKEYQRLKEDRSPSSPETPRIYRPPPNGDHFSFPDIPDGRDPKGCE